MKQKQFNELKNKSAAEWQQMLGEYRTKLHSMQLDLYAGKVKNVKTIRDTKKTIARLLTLLREHKADFPSSSAAA